MYCAGLSEMEEEHKYQNTLFSWNGFFCISFLLIRAMHCTPMMKCFNIQNIYTGCFFNCSHPKISKCQPVSKLRSKKLEYQNCSHPKKKLRKKKV